MKYGIPFTDENIGGNVRGVVSKRSIKSNFKLQTKIVTLAVSQAVYNHYQLLAPVEMPKSCRQKYVLWKPPFSFGCRATHILKVGEFSISLIHVNNACLETTKNTEHNY